LNCQRSDTAAALSSDKEPPLAEPPSPRKSAEMARVRTRDTAPELAVRAVLHHAGFRYRLHDRRLPGTPDVSLPRHRLAIFVHGCFWHGHAGCPRAAPASTRADFWAAKVGRNAERDRAAVIALAGLGWRSLTIWGCEVRNGSVIAARLSEGLDMQGRPVREHSKPKWRSAHESKSRRSMR